MIASDSELPTGRVLVQEVLLNAIRPEDGENARRAVAQRLLQLRSYSALPRLVDHFSEQWRHFLVFEFPSGDLLADRLQRARGPLPEEQAIRLGLQILDALEDFEREVPPFIHGNLSPEAIILRPSGQIVIVGCSAHLLLYPDGLVDHPPAGGVRGYGAPEQSRGQATTRSDIFAVCAILHHAVTGVAPNLRANAQHPPARHLNPDVSLEMEEILSQGMRPSAMQRYQKASDLQNALERLASGQATHVPEELREDGARSRGPVLVRDSRGRLVLPRQRRFQNPLFLFGIVLSLIVLIGGAVLFATSPHPTVSNPVPTANPMVQLMQEYNIGLSGGEFAFDTQRQDQSYKQQGSENLVTGDLKDAYSAFKNAVGIDPTDAEAAIYAEDLRISLNRAPFVTVVVGTAFDPNADPSDIGGARSELQGVYLAQHHINSAGLLPGGVKLRVVVLNSGASVDNATRAADALLQLWKNGNQQHFIGIIGWPELAQTQQAQAELNSSGLPFITPTVSDNGLASPTASVFRMVPLDSEQAQSLADVAVQRMGATSIVVLSDPKDPVSSSMGVSFAIRALDDQTNVPLSEHPASYTSNVGTNFNSIAQEAVVHDHADLIYLSTGQQGGDLDAINLAKAVISVSQTAGVLPPRILVDSRAFTPALLGLGTSQEATTIRGEIVSPGSSAISPGGGAIYSDLYVETLANIQEWASLKLPSTAADTFTNQFSSQYGTTLSPDQLPGPNATIILSYDAFDMLAAATSPTIQKSKGRITYPTFTQLRTNILAFTPAHPFIGVSGAISYDLLGNVNGDSSRTDSGPTRAIGVMGFVPFVSTPGDGQLASPQMKYIGGAFDPSCAKSDNDCGLTLP
jgi:serine/threonine-protein kinase